MENTVTYPKARRDGLLVDQVGDETIVYDGERQEAHSLNRSASIVWHHSDGTRSVQQLAALIGTELGINPDESLVTFALDELSRVNLLETGATSARDALSRREAVRRITIAGAAMVAVPVILSVAVPTPAMAASGTQNSQGQNNNNQGPNGQ